MALSVTNLVLSKAELAAAARGAANPKLARRILGIRAVLMGYGVPDAANLVGSSERSLERWVHRYNEKGLAGLRAQSSPGRPRLLDQRQAGELRAVIQRGPSPGEGIAAYRGLDIVRIIRELFGIKTSLSGVYLILHRLGLSNLSPRPTHPKGDPAKREAFKKTSRRRSMRSSAPIQGSASRSGSRTKPASA